MNKEELEERLIDFSVAIIQLTDSLPNTRAGNYLGGQLIRSGTSAALNYGEARSAESRKDFIHKFQVILKELRESYIALKIISKARLYDQEIVIEKSLSECNELISIFVKSVQTANKNKKNSR
ncbi:MAG: four helix bundle protein [Balneolaceae bacterium]|nr:MAG: four helix bundle protein [Balneolaceae bacterium]